MSSYIDYSIKTRTEFKNWIMRQLGQPLITIELRDENLDDCINDQLEEFTEYAQQDRKYFAVNLKDYISDKGYIMPGNVQAVTNLYDYGVHGATTAGINPFSFNFMLVQGGFVPSPFNGRSARSGWLDYHLQMSWLDLTYQMTGKGFDWEYNPRTKMLILNPDPLKYFHFTHGDAFTGDEGCWIIAECYCVRPDEQNYGESWVKRMALQNQKVLIGNIRSTYSNINLVGGQQINGSEILSQGNTEKEQLRNELVNKYPVFGLYHG